MDPDSTIRAAAVVPPTLAAPVAEIVSEAAGDRTASAAGMAEIQVAAERVGIGSEVAALLSPRFERVGL